jgi:hypothetical protein
MSLLLSGAKTITFAGTEMQCLEIYTGEAYTIGLNFTDTTGTPIDITSYTLLPTVAYYSVDTVTYNDALGQIDLGNITVDPGTPTPPVDLAVTKLTPFSNGQAVLYVPDDLTDGLLDRPSVPLVNGKADPTVLAIITVKITRPNTDSGKDDVSKEPIGFIVRYQ